MGRWWTIFCYIVVWHLSCGVSFLDNLGFNWYYQARLLSYYVSGGFGEGKKSRILFLYVCCGLYGGKEIDELLKMWKPRGVNCYQPSLAPYILCIGFYR